MEKISRLYRLRNDEVLQKNKKRTNLTYKERKVNWIGYILLWNRLLKHVTEGKLQERSDAKTKEKT
jgi:hypothetical protein